MHRIRQILFVPPAPFVWAQRLGLFERHGVDVNTTQTTSSDQLGQGLAAGTFDIGIGVDMGEEYPKPLTDEVVRAADVVITMGCGDACPIYPGKRYEDWTLEDPAGQDLDTVRRIRDEIDTRVRKLISELLA